MLLYLINAFTYILWVVTFTKTTSLHITSFMYRPHVSETLMCSIGFVFGGGLWYPGEAVLWFCHRDGQLDLKHLWICACKHFLHKMKCVCSKQKDGCSIIHVTQQPDSDVCEYDGYFFIFYVQQKNNCYCYLIFLIDKGISNKENHPAPKYRQCSDIWQVICNAWYC